MSTTTAPAADGRMSLMEHLIELRQRLMKCAIAVFLSAIVGWIVYNPVLDILAEPLVDLSGDPDIRGKFQSFDPLEIFTLRVKMSLYLGLIIAMPFLLWQLWKFIAPGLYENERRYAGLFVFSATLLFLLGAAIAYFTLPEALKFLQSMGGDDVEFQYTATSYVMLIVYMMVAFGAGFQFPIVLVALQAIGIVSPERLAKSRRLAIVIITIVAAVITPSADPISLFALAIPMTIFYEISILIGKLLTRRRRKRAAQVGAS